MNSKADERPPYLAISAIAAATLAYEIHLLNLFSNVYWYHFGYMVISIAMLGVGISGTFLYITSNKVLRRPSLFFLVNSLVFCISSVFLYGYVQIHTFNALEVLWQWQSWGDLLLIYILLMCPFIAGANCIAASLMVYRDKLGGIYSADLVGAGLGAALVCLFMEFVSSAVIIQGIFLLAFFAVIVVIKRAVKELLEVRGSGKLVVGGLCFVLTATVLWVSGLPNTWYGPHPNPYKDVSRALTVSGAKEIYRAENRYGLTQVLENPIIPFRSAPGLSSSFAGQLPVQYAVFNNGDWQGAISTFSREDVNHLQFLPSYLAPLILKSQRVEAPDSKILVNDWASLLQIDNALPSFSKRGLAKLYWVNSNPNMHNLVADVFEEESGWNQLHVKPRYVQKNERQFVLDAFDQSETTGFDLIQLEIAPALFGMGSGVSALAQDYVLTKESIRSLFNGLSEAGLLSFNFTDSIPPKLTYKLISTLKAGGGTELILSEHLLVIRSWQQVSIVVSARPLTEQGIQMARDFARRMKFSLVYFPGIEEYKDLSFSGNEYSFYQGVLALLESDSHSFFNKYVYNIAASTDSEPNFYHFFRWQSFWELFSKKEQGGTPLIEWSYLVLVLTLVQAILVSLVLVVSPVFVFKWWKSRRILLSNKVGRQFRFMSYFAAIGFGFMFIEINLIQRVMFNFHHPTVALAVIIGGLLVFSGIGAWLCQSMLLARSGAKEFAADLKSKLARLLSVTIGVILIYIWLLPMVLKAILIYAMWAQVILVLIMMAPLACLLGVPLPAGLALLNDNGLKKPYPQYGHSDGLESARLESTSLESQIPLAWAINACCSVIGAVLATLLALHVSLHAVWCLAALCYAWAIYRLLRLV